MIPQIFMLPAEVLGQEQVGTMQQLNTIQTGYSNGWSDIIILRLILMILLILLKPINKVMFLFQELVIEGVLFLTTLPLNMIRLSELNLYQKYQKNLNFIKIFLTRLT